MQLARVIGPVVSTVKQRALNGRTLLLVQPVTPQGAPQGQQMIAVDTVSAGEGDLVLLLDEGTGARQVMHDLTAPVRTVIVGIVDDVELALTIPHGN
ncbi:MAG: EutN/CcmL family microcompartment protein [Candidatus Sericytochromatia bacterium]|nr:EutN/CcmL family microcompartment protein [Candidatus Sericytochromatia bacterium]